MTRTTFDHDIAGQTVLVTGGAGFIGSNIADALVDDNEVRVLDNLSTGSHENVPAGAELLVGDITNSEDRAEAMDGVDLVFHEAAIVSVTNSVEIPLSTNHTNADATLGLLEDARRADARYVFASSAAIYGHPEAVPIGESHPKRPNSPYGVSKLAADHYTRLYADLYGLPTVALRYFNAYGPGQPGGNYSGVISTFFEQARAGDPITVEGDGEQTRDFVNVADIVRANLRAATTGNVGRAYNVGTGETVTIGELADLIKTAVGSGSSIQFGPARDGDIRHSRAETTAARERLDFEAEVSLADGLRKMTESDAETT